MPQLGLQPVERRFHLRHAHHRPDPEVLGRRGAERGEVSADELHASLEGVEALRLLECDVASEEALATRAPERGIGGVHDVRAHACSAPGASRVHAGETVLLLQIGERLGGGHWLLLHEPTDLGREALRDRGLVVVVGLLQGRSDQPVVAACHEMDRLSEQGGADDIPALERSLQRGRTEARSARPDPDVRRLRRLRLHPDEMLDHAGRRQALPLEEELPCQGGPVELPGREDALRQCVRQPPRARPRGGGHGRGVRP